MKRNIKIVTLAVLASTIIATSFFASVGAHADQTALMKYSIALIGDMPYDAKGVAQTPNVIADINSNSNIKFTLFDGFGPIAAGFLGTLPGIIAVFLAEIANFLLHGAQVLDAGAIIRFLELSICRGSPMPHAVKVHPDLWIRVLGPLENSQPEC